MKREFKLIRQNYTSNGVYSFSSEWKILKGDPPKLGWHEVITVVEK